MLYMFVTTVFIVILWGKLVAFML